MAAAFVLQLTATPAAATDPGCVASGLEASLDEILSRVEAEGVKFLFIGEDHRVGPVKRFAVDAVNALTRRGHDVGLYVEGFRTDCPPTGPGCRSLADLFNRAAFLTLLQESQGRVHPIDPPGTQARVARMAATIDGGAESIRVVLVGRSHVIHAGNPAAQHRVYGGGLLYPNPGDLAEAFPRAESLTFSLELAEGGESASYSLRSDGCVADYTLVAAPVSAY